mmetsp:Transcript_26923/g.35996  ORF Transcript_26923/g.35996 Transcript_26923/m.35996 type:complete len:86 (-) Transcript_26923:134-391(-)
MERELVTTDSTKDLNFTPTATTPDYMVMKPGRAIVFINKSTAAFANGAISDAEATDIELAVPLRASSLFALSLATLASSIVTLSF